MFRPVLHVAALALSLLGWGFATGIVDFERGAGAISTEVNAPSGLGYLGATPVRSQDRGKVGVVTHKHGDAIEGLNLYTPCGWGSQYERRGGGAPLRLARLMDMEGTVLHTWSATYPWDQDVVRDEGRRGRRGWAAARFDGQANLVVVHSGIGLLKLDWDSNLVWGRPEFYHHDLTFDGEGNIVSLVDAERDILFEGRHISLIDNGIAFVRPDGQLDRILWLYDALRHHPRFAEVLARQEHGKDAKPTAATSSNTGAAFGDARRFFSKDHRRHRRGLDVLHPNAVFVLPRTVEGLGQAGDVLTSLREFDMLAVFDAITGKLRWSWGASHLDGPHDPALLSNGHLIVFDNGRYRGASRIVELDPVTREVVLSYTGEGQGRFFSSIRGQVQALDDHWLIVESQRGRAFEVDRRGQIVWEFYGPDMVGPDYRVPLRLRRLTGPILDKVRARLAGAPPLAETNITDAGVDVDVNLD